MLRRQVLFTICAIITALSGVIFFFCGSADNIDHRIEQRPLANRHVVVSSATGAVTSYSDISVPAAALGRPAKISQARHSRIDRNGSVGVGAGRARMAVDLSVDVSGLSSAGYSQLGRQ